MILAQATIAEGTGMWVGVGTLFTIVCVQVGKLLSDARKDKRDAELDKQKTEYLKSIATTNQAALTAQREVKVALDARHELDSERHHTLLGAINNLPCKKCENSKPTK